MPTSDEALVNRQERNRGDGRIPSASPLRGEEGGEGRRIPRDLWPHVPLPNSGHPGTLPQSPGCVCDEVPQEPVGGDEQDGGAYSGPKEREQPPAPALQHPRYAEHQCRRGKEQAPQYPEGEDRLQPRCLPTVRQRQQSEAARKHAATKEGQPERPPPGPGLLASRHTGHAIRIAKGWNPPLTTPPSRPRPTGAPSRSGSGRMARWT